MTTTSRLPANEVGASMVTDNFKSTSPKQDATKDVIDGKMACVDDSGRSACSKIYCFSTGAE